MHKTTEIPLLIIPIQDDGFHIFLKASLNHEEVYMLLDTGASRTVFDMETLKKIHAGIELEKNQDNATGLGTNGVENFTTTIQKLGLGDIEINDYQAGALDLVHVNTSYNKIDIPPIAGVLGSDILVKYQADISYRAKTLKLVKI